MADHVELGPTYHQRKQLKGLHEDPDAPKWQDKAPGEIVLCIQRMTGWYSDSALAPNGKRPLEQKERMRREAIQSRGLKEGTEVVFSRTKLRGRMWIITAITEDWYLILQGIEGKVPPNSAYLVPKAQEAPA